MRCPTASWRAMFFCAGNAGGFRALGTALGLIMGLWQYSAFASLIFGPATPVTALNSSSSDRLSWISPDGLTAVIASDRLGSDDLFSATRPNLTSPFSTPTTFPFTTVNNATFNSAQGVLSANGLELFYHSANSSTAAPFYRATRGSTAAQFSSGSPVNTLPVTIPGFSPGGFNRPSWLSADGERIYYFTDFGVLKLGTRTLPATAFTPSAFDPFVNIHAGGTAVSAVLSPDELTVIFSSNRAGTVGLGDLWYATRGNINNPFGSPINLASINTAAGEGSPFWQGNTLYFSRSGDIYSAQLLNNAVPEPASLLLALGGIGMAFGLRRQPGSH